MDDPDILKEYNAMVKGFMKIYRENGVKMIGMWFSKEEYFGYTMTAYRDQDHYQDFIESMKHNTKYQDLSKLFDTYRISITSETLELFPGSPSHIELNDYSLYIEQAKQLMRFQ